MISIPMFGGKIFPIPEIGINYAIESYDDFLIKILSVDGFTLHELHDSYGGRPIYGFSMGDLENKDVFYIDGCIHKGHEWRTSYWIMHFMEALNDPETHWPEMSHKINKLKSKYAFYFVPVVAPDAFESSFRGGRSPGNDNGVDIAKNFDYNWDETTGNDKGTHPFSEPETVNVKNIVDTYQPTLYVNCHSHGGSTGFILRRPLNSEYDILYRGIFESNVASTKHTSNTEIARVYGMSSAYNWTSNQKNSRNQPIASSVFEVGDRENSEWQSRIGVTGLLMHIMYVDNYLTNTILSLF